MRASFHERPRIVRRCAVHLPDAAALQ